MLFSKKQKALISVCNGTCIPIAEIPDEAFSQGMLGKGYGIIPEDTGFYSPADGKIESVAESKHAYSIATDDGLDILVHIGIDTVELKGAAFEPLVSEGQRVKAGDAIAKADIELIKQRGLSPISAVLVTDSEKIENIAYKFGNTAGGKDVAMYYSLKK